jgi:RNA polymerase sigma-70 factor (ECF subfamily)
MRNARASAPEDSGTSLNTSASLLLRLRPESEAREVAWEEFHRRYAAIIGGFARKLGVSGAEADELVQDVLVGFFATSDRFTYDPGKGRFRSFLKVCTFRMLCKSRQRNAKFQGVPVELVDPQAPQVEQAWDETWEREHVRRALTALKQRYSINDTRARTFRAFELYALNGQPQEQVARELGISIDSVHRAKHRLTAALKKAVSELRECEG